MVDVFSNTFLLANIHQYGWTLRLSCNAGIVTTTLVGDLEEYKIVWYHTKGIANILYLYQFNNLYRFTYGSTRGKCFTVHKGYGSIRRFVEPP